MMADIGLVAANIEGIIGYEDTNVTESTANQTNAAIYDVNVTAITKVIKIVILPCYVILGFVGNSISIMVFKMTPMKHYSCTVFLIALAASDNTFLVTLFFTWIDETFHTPILRTNIVCQITIYLSSVSSFLSAWFVVSLTLERFIAICHPFYTSRLFTRSREKYTILTLLIFGAIVYTYTLWTIEIQTAYGQDVCVHSKKFLILVFVMQWFDTIATFVIPVVILFASNIGIVATIVRYRHKHAKKSAMMIHTHGARRVSNSVYLSSSTQRKITRLLMTVTVSFFFMVIPSHAFRLTELIKYTFTGELDGSTLKHICHESFQLLYWMTFCINFFLYALSGKLFRKYLFWLLRRRKMKVRRRSSHEHLYMKPEIIMAHQSMTSRSTLC